MRPFREAEPWRGTEPAIEIRLGVEQPPTVTLIAFNERDEHRILEWLRARPDLQQLINWAGEYGHGLRTIQSIIAKNLIDRADELEEAA